MRRLSFVYTLSRRDWLQPKLRRLRNLRCNFARYETFADNEAKAVDDEAKGEMTRLNRLISAGNAAFR